MRDTAPNPLSGEVFVTPKGFVARAEIKGQPVFFAVANPRDSIQRSHMAGAFYEPEELAIIEAHFPKGGVFFDIGTNVGNHTLYALMFLGASRAIVVEPNPDAIALLTANLALNGLTGRVDMSLLGKGLSDRAAGGLSLDVPDRNLGGARMVEGGGTLEVMRGDDAIRGQKVDFIKMDVEGMELQVLNGLSQTLATHKPKIFIEVNNENRDGFFAWVKANGYRVGAEFRRYRLSENFLLLPA